MTDTLFEAAGGKPVILELARAWHARCLADPVVSHAFSHGVHSQHVERLATYWSEALGGPPEYTESMGSESSVMRMHSGNGEHQEMDERAQSCFEHALADVGFPEDLRSTLTEYFGWATQRMAAHPDSSDQIPDDLPLVQWSWNGPS